MRTLKLFILIGFLCLLFSAGATAYVWNLVQQTLAEDTAVEDATVLVPETQHGSIEESEVLPVEESLVVPEEGIRLPANTLSDGQKKAAKAVGIDVDKMVITQDMVTCAKAKVGVSRMKEVMQGDTPTLMEGVQLASCI